MSASAAAPTSGGEPPVSYVSRRHLVPSSILLHWGEKETSMLLKWHLLIDSRVIIYPFFNLRAKCIMAKFTSQPPYVPTPSLLTDALGCRLLYSIVPFVRPSKDDYLFLVSFQEHIITGTILCAVVMCIGRLLRVIVKYSALVCSALVVNRNVSVERGVQLCGPQK